MDFNKLHQYWRKNLRYLAILLFIWFAVSYGCGILFAEQLNHFRIGGFPLGFWFAQQGSIYVFITLTFVYAFAMDRIDRRHGVDNGSAANHSKPTFKRQVHHVLRERLRRAFDSSNTSVDDCSTTFQCD